MRPLPLLSIVTPSFNQGEFLRECIESVVEQDYPHIEYIIIDGGSTDDSINIIRDYEDRISYWHSKPDGGQFEAIESGFARSTGSIMAWINADDKYHPGAFKAVAEVFQKGPGIEWITGRPTAYNAKGEITKIFAPSLAGPGKTISMEPIINVVFNRKALSGSAPFGNWQEATWTPDYTMPVILNSGFVSSGMPDCTQWMRSSVASDIMTNKKPHPALKRTLSKLILLPAMKSG